MDSCLRTPCALSQIDDPERFCHQNSRKICGGKPARTPTYASDRSHKSLIHELELSHCNNYGRKKIVVQTMAEAPYDHQKNGGLLDCPAPSCHAAYVARHAQSFGTNKVPDGNSVLQLVVHAAASPSPRKVTKMKKLSVAVISCTIGCSEIVEISTVEQNSLSPNPCNAVALTVPTNSFVASVGTPIALSASATCPVDQTPEFQFWGKNVGDQNWTILTRDPVTALPSHVPGASSYTPTADDAGDWCFSVAVRAVGAPENFQARSGGTCGVVGTGGPEPDPTTTITIDGTAFHPITSATTIDCTGDCIFIGGIGVQAPVILPNNVTITGVRFSVRDNQIGPTILQGGIIARDSSGALTGHISSGTSGSGNLQVLTIDRETPIVSGKSYFLKVFHFSGLSASATIFAEIDYR